MLVLYLISINVYRRDTQYPYIQSFGVLWGFADFCFFVKFRGHLLWKPMFTFFSNAIMAAILNFQNGRQFVTIFSIFYLYLIIQASYELHFGVYTNVFRGQECIDYNHYHWIISSYLICINPKWPPLLPILPISHPLSLVWASFWCLHQCFQGLGIHWLQSFHHWIF